MIFVFWLYFGLKDTINYRFLTTETNLKALYIFRCLFTISSVKLFLVNVQIFCLQLCFLNKGKTTLTKPLSCKDCGWFESTTWNSNHKWNQIDMKISHECILHNKKRKDTFERLEKLTPVFSLFSWNYLYYSIWKESYGYSLFPSALFISVSSVMKFLILNKANNAME